MIVQLVRRHETGGRFLGGVGDILAQPGCFDMIQISAAEQVDQLCPFKDKQFCVADLCRWEEKMFTREVCFFNQNQCPDAIVLGPGCLEYARCLIYISDCCPIGRLVYLSPL
ncbi:hypothetical protein ASD15_17260 [Massilia sp. Root351]|nr:hypothetical protein ASD15_17260 [Massilia sp. Root351]